MAKTAPRPPPMKVANNQHSLADFLVLRDLLDVEQVVQPSLVVLPGQTLVHHRLREELVGRQRDLVAGQQAALQLGHGLVGRELHDGLAGGVPSPGRQQELLPGRHQVFQVWGGGGEAAS